MVFSRFVWMLVVLSLCITFRFASAEMKPLFVDCGSGAIVTVDGRVWFGDSVSSSNLSLSYHGSVANISGIDEPQALYRTVRIFNMSSNYTFSVPSGSYYIRLHFFPFVTGDVSADRSSFSVVANNLKLVSHYNVSDEIWRQNSYFSSLNSNQTVKALIKEYFVNSSLSSLWIEFTPSSGSFAFVNAIEVVPVTDKYFFGSVDKVSNGVSSSLNLVNGGMETMYRLNVEGSEIKPNQDQDLWRKWEQDGIYMLSENTASLRNSSALSYTNRSQSSVAPLTVYTSARITPDSSVSLGTFNMSWKFKVDPNFDYIVRLHFCELSYNGIGQRVFNIYIDSMVAAQNFDVFDEAGGKNKAYYKDFIVSITPEVNVLWVQLGSRPLAVASHTTAILNGMEIFKLSRKGDLSYISTDTITGHKGQQSKNRKAKIIGIVVGVTVFSLTILLILYLWFCSKKKDESSKEINPTWRPLVVYGANGSMKTAQESRPTSLVHGLVPNNRAGTRFTIMDIRAATKDFDESLVIGTGGFGKVYKGEIEGNLVAVKRAHPNSSQGIREFETEIEMLSKLRHRHLVSMIGYCDEHKEMILVYEYMANGTLRNHLFGSGLPPLSWKQRLNACVGAARGLHYLHTGADRGIIHRDVKTTNILLDENFVAKMSDFGLSKTGPALDHTHVSTAVKGSFGYLDPEYFRRQKLTKKSDVYSFGVVLFEVACARPVINPTLPKEQINLAEWAIKWQRQGDLEAIVDPRLENDYSLESLLKFGEIAEKCLADDGTNRPTMGEVLWHLENVVQLNTTCMSGVDGDSSSSREMRSMSVSQQLPFIKEEEVNFSPEPNRLEENSLLSMYSLDNSSFR